MNITQKDLDRVKKRCLESLGDFLSELCRDKLMGPLALKRFSVSITLHLNGYVKRIKP